MFLAAASENGAAFWAVIGIALGAGGGGTVLVQYLRDRYTTREGRLAKRDELAAQRELREAALEEKTIDRLWSLVTEHQAQISQLQRQVEEFRREKHAALTQVESLGTQLAASRVETGKWKAAAAAWYRHATRAIDALGPERAKSLGLPVAGKAATAP